MPLLTVTPRARRLVATGLIAYGFFGLLLIAGSGLLVGGAITTVVDASGRVGDQRDALIEALRATSQTVDHAASGVGGVGDSLAAARTSSDQAKELARSLGTTLRQLSAGMQIQLFGTQPLAGLSAGFDTAASQSEALATDLADVSTALGSNSADLATTQHDLATLGDRIDRLVASLDATPFGGVAGGIPAVLIEAAFIGLLVWLAIPAVGALAVGIGLLRGTLR